MQNKTGQILKYTVSLAVAAVLLYFSFKEVEWKDFIAVLKECRWGFVILAMVAGVGGAFFRGARWRLLLLPLDSDTKASTCFNAVNISRLADFVVPHSCELVRCGFVTTKKASFDKALGTVVLERAWDIVTLLGLIILLLAFKWNMFGTFFTEKIWAPVTGQINFSLWWVVVLLVAALALLLVVPAVRKFVKGILNGASSCLHMEHKGLFVLYTVLLWTMFLLMSLTIIWALPQSYGLTIVDAFFIMLVGCVASIVPVPGGFGAFHYIVALALSSIYGIPFEMGIVFATLSHEAQAVMMLLAGGYSYAHESIKRR